MLGRPAHHFFLGYGTFQLNRTAIAQLHLLGRGGEGGQRRRQRGRARLLPLGARLARLLRAGERGAVGRRRRLCLGLAPPAQGPPDPRRHQVRKF